jgi:hypothetical protein
MKRSVIAVAALAFLPMLSFAQNDAPSLGNIETLVESIGRIVNLLTPILIGLALLAFFWGLIKYIFSEGDDGKKDGKKLMIWGIIAIFIMVSIVGIIRFIGNAFGVDQGGALPVPGVQQRPDTR